VNSKKFGIVARGMASKLAVAVPAAALALAGGSVAAQAAPAATHTIVDHATGFCLDSATNNNAYTLRCNEGSFQNWVYNPTTSTIRDVATGYCLDSNTDGKAYALPCNGGNFQNWQLTFGVGTIRDVATGLCLDSNTDGALYTLPCNGGDFQNWIK
jgi:hypothetical protein